MTRLEKLNRKIIACRACPRLVEWRERVGQNPPKQYRGQTYWSKPLPGFGDPHARVMVVGLAPAANGGNRTGRIFTGDRSGDFLFRALFEVGLATAPRSESIDDGTELKGCYLTAVVRCAPPKNKPTPLERDTCIPYLIEEIDIVAPAAIVALGKFAWDGVLRAARMAGAPIGSPLPRFAHSSETNIEWRGRSVRMFGSYHPSQQNTFTGKLTMEMLVDVLRKSIAAGFDR